MKILHLLYESEGDYFGIGGVGLRAYEIYNRMRDRHDITLLCRKYPGAKDGEVRGLKHVFAGTESRNFTRTLLAYAWHAARHVRDHGVRYDVIVEEFSPAIPTFLASYRSRPVVLQIQGYTGRQYFAKYNPAYAAALYLSERVRPHSYRNIIVVSEATKVRYGLENSERRDVVVISNGIPDGLLSVDPTPSDYALYLGRLDIHHKGLDILLGAYRSFHAAHPDMRLVIAGDGRDKERFLGLVRRLPEEIRDSITMPGWVAGDEKTALIRDAVMMVVPSRYETQGIVALEGMACAKPLIVSGIPELRYAVACGAAVPFVSGNEEALAEAMSSLAGRSDLADVGLRGREWVKGLTWDRVAERFEDYLLSVVKGKER